MIILSYLIVITLVQLFEEMWMGLSYSSLSYYFGQNFFHTNIPNFSKSSEKLQNVPNAAKWNRIRTAARPPLHNSTCRTFSEQNFLYCINFWCRIFCRTVFSLSSQNVHTHADGGYRICIEMQNIWWFYVNNISQTLTWLFIKT